MSVEIKGDITIIEEAEVYVRRIFIWTIGEPILPMLDGILSGKFPKDCMRFMKVKEVVPIDESVLE